MSLETLLILIPLFPLLACLIVAVLGAKVLHERSHWPVAIACGLSFVCSLALMLNLNSAPGHTKAELLYTWMDIPQFADPGAMGGGVGDAIQPVLIQIKLRADSLTALMLSMVTFISTLVVIYASGYMHGERGYWRFFSVVALFVFSMINLVLASNFVQLFMFWEAVGLCSYLLIGFWYEKPEAAAAGMKAFIVNRIGDFGFALGIFLIWVTFKSVDFDVVLVPSAIAGKDPTVLAMICFGLFTGAVGKSAQFPLQVWLPDAMEGPTPVSALIHAATMVTAGVYMVTRCTLLFMEVPDVQTVVACVGGLTALLAALIALTQTDLKRVLAYSTVSQLGYMVLALGAQSILGVTGGMFHLVTHAFFKALLFLAAGSVMHAMGGIIDMRKFGGLRHVMPQTHMTFLCGALALAGLFPLSGFWSKDTVLSAVHAAAYGSEKVEHHAEGAGHPPEHKTEVHKTGTETAKAAENHEAPKLSLTAIERREYPVFGLKQRTIFKFLYWSGVFTAFLTAFYTSRAYFLTFWGEEKIPHEAGHHAHESPPVMTIPLWILAGGAVMVGMLLGHPTGLFNEYLGLTIQGAAAHEPMNWTVAITSTILALAGIGLGFVMYGQPSSLPALFGKLFGPLTTASQKKLYLDETFSSLLVMPLKALAQVSRFLDWILIDTLLVNGIGSLPGLLLGKPARPMQNGLVQFYALSMMLALAVLLWALLLRQA